MIIYKLIDGITAPQTIKIAERINKVTRYARMILKPNVTYEHDDDDIFKAALKDAKVQVRYTPEMENMLKDNKVPYDVKVCKSCGGKMRKLEYCAVEVIE